MFSLLPGDHDVKNMRVHCENATSGCLWTGELHSLDKHLSECSYFYCSCPNKCEKNFEILYKDLHKHLLECPKRLYECPHCHIDGEYQERTTTHLNECPKMKVVCSHDGCSVAVDCDMFEHRIVCPYAKVACRYARIGCESRIAQKDLARHEENVQVHLQLAIESVLRLQSICSSLMCTDQTTGNLPIFKFVKFEERKAIEAVIYSSPFYTNSGGYKLCIRVHANGNTTSGTGRGSHVSVYAFLMQGENDDQLPWPFTGTVTVELLNQLEDSEHHSMCLDFSQNTRSNKRVVDTEMADSGFGHPKFIDHLSLGYDSARRCQYLMNDCLYFRFKT